MSTLLFLVLALAAWLALRFAAGYGPGDPAVRQLSAREQGVIAATADAVFPPGGSIPISGTEAGIVRYLDHYLGMLPPRNRILIRLLFVLIEHATLLFPAPGWNGFRRFSSLDPAQRNAVLEAWGQSALEPRRLVFQSLRTVLAMGYFASPAVLRATGVAPLAIETPVVEADLLYPPIGAPRSAITAQPADRERATPRAPLDPHGPLAPGYADATAWTPR